ncbi:pimeloyl-ACP methyl ester carboxylesterase [Rhizobium sp. BK650]|uniref:alpha/beta fold hydrolase n=1 Tax=Rhizobium sp. BK650 TaxID=2586990 RepID=UPI00161FD811|nr:alpha/beta hydrolase [Rhizobium sp. BK650]MBB3656694.1 pimeloyl-ACP methyl ester carboxylesterase [Rhizobium sp. BK650]
MKYGQPLPPPAASPQVGEIIETGREQIHMLESGSADGNPVVLLHGCGSIAEEVMMPFAGSGLNIISPDRPGYGFSQALPAGERGPLGQSFWLERFLEALEFKEVVLAAHSIGCAPALHLSARRPDLVKGLFLISPCCRPVPFKPFIVLRSAMAPFVGPVIRQHVIARWSAYFLERGLRASSYPNPVTSGLSTLPAMHMVNAASIATMAEELWAFNGDMQPLESLPADLPLSILFGREDRVIEPLWHLDWLQERHPSAKIELLDGVGHMPHHVARDLALAMLGDLAGKTPGDLAGKTLDMRR